MKAMELVFEALAEPNRRAILGALTGGERSVGELEARLGLSQPSISKHLRVLREAGMVNVRGDAQRRMYRLRHERLMALDAWLEPYRRLWRRHLDALERHLDSMPDEPTKTKGGKR
jgi:DNA-binding transcriptional ArsR family regulator